MKLSDDEIQKLIKIAENGENKRADICFRYENDGNILAGRLLEGKILVDRWCNVTNCVIFNTQHENFVNQTLRTWASKKNNPNSYYDGLHIWGADIEYSDAIPLNKILLAGMPISNKIDDVSEFNESTMNGRFTAIIPMVEYRKDNNL